MRRAGASTAAEAATSIKASMVFVTAADGTWS
jgi:hypothetical protein